jgi:hypothetical protein
MKRLIVLIAACLLTSSAALSESPSTASPADFTQNLAASPPRNPFELRATQQTTATLGYCCKVCSKGKPCGDTCIAQNKICHVGPGCAC